MISIWLGNLKIWRFEDLKVMLKLIKLRVTWKVFFANDLIYIYIYPAYH